MGLGYYGKRSAEPEAKADPYYLGGYYGGYGLGYANYGYGLGHYGYGLGYYGKRSADAEADPYYYGGYYGGYGRDTMVDMDMVLATTAMDVAFMATMDKSTNPYLVPDLHQLRDLDLHQDLSVNQVLPPCQ